ncbi:hypothetical protein BCR42DRAFT_454831 [Absidia repens]|uniref:Xylanolytic transcriptional activator regulatory domain-containing protein n=1 Tax=Absidia repens TaxID=90262 RepID=A0A1X2I724_9FUNG|nr:hypothetical protein BCR42DRAFT_454831 [Absidia repens]
MQNNFPPLKRQKHGIDLGAKCLQCDAQQQQDGTCPHLTLTNDQQLSMEYRQLQEASEDPSFDMEDIERRLRKLETQLTLRLKGEGNTEKDHHHQPYNNSNSNNNSNSPSFSIQQQHRNDPAISLTATGITISTKLTESHHFFKHLVSGVNPTFVRQKAAEVYSRRIDLAGPAYGNPNNTHGISNLAIDKEDLEELVWFDMVLATRYAKCFLIYQMVEKDRLVEWVSSAYIDNLKGQVKLEHSLLSKAVRAFVYGHEKLSTHNEITVGGDVDPLRRQQNINLNRDVFFFQQAEELLELCYMTSNRNTIRALLHMYMYQVMTPGGHAKAVHYSDLALRMAQALKLNTEKGMLVNDQLREDDRRLWWSTVWIHLWSCVALQRPLMLYTSDIMVPGSRPPSKRQNESSQVGYCIDLCVHSVKLLLISQSIRQRLVSTTTTTEATLLLELKDMEHQLDAWSLAVPEPLQPRFWNNNNNINNSSNTPLSPSLDQIDDSGNHDHNHVLSAQAFAMEIGSMLQGLGVLAKTQLYECYGTNDGSILDLLVVRNRLQVAMDYVNHLAQSINRIRPCVKLIMLTLTGPCLSTLLTLVNYQHNPEVAEQAIRHLVGLKTMLQTYPFLDDRTAQKWIFDIDQILAQHGPSLVQLQLQQQQTANVNDSPRNLNGGMAAFTNMNESTSEQLQLRHHPHQYSTSLHQITSKIGNGNNMQPVNIDPTLFTTSTSSVALLEDREMQQYQVYGSTALGKTALVEELDLYRFHYAGAQQTQPPHLPSGQHFQSSRTASVAQAPPTTTTSSSSPSSRIPSYHNNNIALPPFEGSQTHLGTAPPPPSSMPHGTSHYGFYQQQNQHPLWLLSREQDHHSSGKQPSWTSPDHLPPPAAPTVDPDQHPFLPYPSTDQHDHRHYG